MKVEIIERNNKKVLKKTKKDGTITYSLKGAYLGTDKKTGKQVTTTITAPTLKALDRKYLDARRTFEENASTRKNTAIVGTINELAEIWFDSYKSWVSSDNTRNKVRSYLDTYIIPRFGDYKIDAIESAEVQQWADQLAEQARSEVNNGKRKAEKGKASDYGAVIHKLIDILDFGMVHFDLKQNVAKHVRIPPKPKPKQRRVQVLHEKELATWLHYLDTLPNTRANRRFKIICDTLLASAFRINELLALEITDLNFDCSEIEVNKTLMWKRADKKLGTKGKVICKNSPKTDSGNRRVTVPLSILKDLKNFHDEMNDYFEKNGLPQTKLIFPTIYGNYMSDRNERTTLIKRLKALGLPDTGFHLFRHTHASLMLNSGANWKELQERMGHKSISTTMDIYAELDPNRKNEAVDILMDRLSQIKRDKL